MGRGGTLPLQDILWWDAAIGPVRTHARCFMGVGGYGTRPRPCEMFYGGRRLWDPSAPCKMFCGGGTAVEPYPQPCQRKTYNCCMNRPTRKWTRSFWGGITNGIYIIVVWDACQGNRYNHRGAKGRAGVEPCPYKMFYNRYIGAIMDQQGNKHDCCMERPPME